MISEARQALLPCRICLHQAAVRVVYACVGQHQQAEPRIRPPVEDVAEERQHEVAQLLRRGIVSPQCQRQKEKDEEVGREEYDDLVIPKFNIFD